MNKNLMIAGVVVLVVIAGVVLFAMKGNSSSTSNQETATQVNESSNTTMQANPTTAEATTGSLMQKEATATSDTNVKAFTVEGSNFSFSLKEIKVKKGDTVKVTFTNKDGMHNWIIDEFNAKTKTIPAGESETVQFVADKVGTFEYYCSVGQHRKNGMVGKLIVE